MKKKVSPKTVIRTVVATTLLSLFLLPTSLCFAADTTTQSPPQNRYDPSIRGKSYGNLRVKVIDGRTLKPIEGAEVVVLETEKRYKTGANGLTPWIQAPVIRSARYRF